MALSREDELTLVARAAAGDRDAMAAVWQEYQRIAWCIARRRARKIAGVDPADLAQEGYFGLADAVKGFDPDRGIRFVTLAWQCVRNRINKHLARRCNVPLPQTTGPLAEDSPTGIPDDWLAREDLGIGEADDLRSLVGTLPDRERRAVELYYGLGEDGRQLDTFGVGREIGVSQPRASHIIRKAVAKLRERQAERLAA